jgi:hypothetical protein
MLKDIKENVKIILRSAISGILRNYGYPHLYQVCVFTETIGDPACPDEFIIALVAAVLPLKRLQVFYIVGTALFQWLDVIYFPARGAVIGSAVHIAFY